MNIQKIPLILLTSRVLAAGSMAAPLNKPVLPLGLKLPKVGGLAVNLETSGVQVPQPAKPVEPAAATDDTTSNPTKLPPALAVSAAVANKGRYPIAVTFDSAEAAKRQITFNLVAEDGTVLWSSDEDLAEGADVEAVLDRGKGWRRVVRVPLILEGEPLALGVYTVEAVVGIGGVASASATFEVVEPKDGTTPPPPPPTKPGGSTTEPADGSTTPPPPPPPKPDPSDDSGTTTLPPPPPPPKDGSGTTPPPPPPPPKTDGGTTSGGTTPPPPPPPTGGTKPPPPLPGASTTDGKLPPPPPPPPPTGTAQ